MRSKQPSDADCRGELLPCIDAVDQKVQVLGRRLFWVGVRAAGVALRAHVVQMPPPPGWGGPRWLFSRLASGVGARLQTHSAPLGAVPGRFVRSLARCGVFSPRPQGGVIALGVRLAGQREGCAPCMVASWLRVAARGSRPWVFLRGAPAGLRRGCVRRATAPRQLRA